MNLFFGMNGMGKSTVVQSLLMVRQSYLSKENLDSLCFKGPLVDFGTANDVLCNNTDDDEIRIHVSDKDNDLDLTCKYDSNLKDNVELQTFSGPIVNNESCLFNKNFAYLGAEHIGPSDNYPVDAGTSLKNYNRMGNKGEYAVPFLAEFGEKVFNKQIIASEAQSDSLLEQVTYWMGKISPGVRIYAEMLQSTEVADLSFGYADNQLVSDKFHPRNVGFGIPYALPLVVALLTAQPGSLLIIENPESHLHPKGQAVLGSLMAMVSNSGVQIICESHSDHIINSIRVAIKEGMLKAEDTTITYFRKNCDQQTEIDKIRVDKRGNLDEYPDGLLDEWGDLMEKLL